MEWYVEQKCIVLEQQRARMKQCDKKVDEIKVRKLRCAAVEFGGS